MMLDIENEHREFEAVNAELFADHSFDRFDGKYADDYQNRYVQLGWTVWLAAKRAAIGSAVPVARLVQFSKRGPKRFRLEIIGDFEPIGDTLLYTAAPAVQADATRAAAANFITEARKLPMFKEQA